MLVPYNQSDNNGYVGAGGRNAFGAHRGSGGPMPLQPLQAPNFPSQGYLQAPTH